MSNPIVQLGVDVFNAIAALKLKRHRLVSTRDGVEIHQPGRPVLLLTLDAAAEFARGMEEAQHD